MSYDIFLFPPLTFIFLALVQQSISVLHTDGALEYRVRSNNMGGDRIEQ